MDASVAETTVSSDHNHEATSHGETVSSVPAGDTRPLGFSLASGIFSRAHVATNPGDDAISSAFPLMGKEGGGRCADNRDPSDRVEITTDWK